MLGVLLEATSIGPVTVSSLEDIERKDRPLVVRRHEGKERLARAFGRSSQTLLVPFATPTLTPPPIATGFPVVGSILYSPADASGAVSKDTLVAATNDSVAIYTKSGEHLRTVPIDVFMRDIPNDTPEYYDPRVIYDRAADRWIMVCVRAQEHIMVAASRTNDARGTWDRYRIPLFSADYTNIALTRDALMIGTRHFDRGSVLTIRKSDLYARPATMPVTERGYTEIDPTPVMNEEGGDEYVAEYLGGGFLVITNHTAGKVMVTTLPTLTSPFGLGLAPQAGTSNLLSTGLSYAVERAVLRKGEIHGVQTVEVGERTGVLWWKVDATTGVLLDSQLFDDPVKYYAYPSFDVNATGATIIGFATFGSTQFVSAGYVYRDARGRVSTAGSVKFGEGPINNTDRWGDYTTTVVDPVDDNAFWTLQIYALRDRWVTWWAKVQTAPIPTRRRAARH